LAIDSGRAGWIGEPQSNPRAHAVSWLAANDDGVSLHRPAREHRRDRAFRAPEVQIANTVPFCSQAIDRFPFILAPPIADDGTSPGVSPEWSLRTEVSMKTWFARPRASALAILPALALFPGCLSDDDSAPEDETLDDAQNAVAAELGESVIELDGNLVAAVPIWFAEGFGAPALREESVIWDPEQQQWQVSFSEDYEDDLASGHIAVTQRVQFLAGGTPVQYPVAGEADEVRVDIEGTNVGTYSPGEAYYVNFDLDLARSIVAVRNGDGSLGWTGSGELGGATEYHVGDRIYPRQSALTWSSDLSWDAGSTCAAGTLSGTNGRADLAATFDGAGHVEWQVVRNGDVLRTGSTDYECSGPPPAE
jgi:hypothetical protein